jgi:branched-chain amino acid aminotransferase
MKTVHYFNGEWVPEEKLLISVKDLSVVRGFGVFDFLRTYQGKPFRNKEHVERFFTSAEFLGLTVPADQSTVIKIVEDGIARNGLPETGVRLTLTGGVSNDPYMVTPGKPSFIVTFGSINSPPATLYEKGGTVITTPHVRHMPRAKSLNYLVAVIAQKEARKVGAVEAVYMDAKSGQIYEGTIANLFVVKDGVVITPHADILLGITRKVALELCDQLGLEHREEDLNSKDLNTYDEMFITGTTKEIMPIIKFDSTRIGDGNPGLVTRRIIQAFDQLVGKKG